MIELCFLLSLLKLWVLVLNYKCPNKCVFLPFYGFVCDNFECPLVNSSKIFTAHQILRDTILNMKKIGVVKAGFLLFAN